MSNFNNTNVSGDYAQLGDNNNQNHTHHHYHGASSQKRKPLEPGDIIGMALSAAILLSAIIWSYFKHTKQIFLYIDLAIVASPLLALVSMIILASRNDVYTKDLNNVMSVGLMALVLFGLSYFLHTSTPESVIELTSRTTPFTFMSAFNGNEHIGGMAVSSFIGALLLIVFAVILHIMSFKQLCSSLGITNQQGFWFKKYNALRFFEASDSHGLMIFLSFCIFGCACWSGQYHLLFIN